MTCKLLFVDDHPLYRDGLARAVTQCLPGAEVVVASDGTAGLALLLADAEFDLVLSDLRLRGHDGQDGFDFLDRAGAAHPTVPRGLLCGDLTAAVAERARRSGHVACLSKDRDMEALAAALQVLLAGGTVFDDVPVPADQLTARRVHILRMAAEGRSNKEIARELGIAERTVKDHWSYIFASLQAANRAEAVGTALRAGLL
jgi:DNA-binding NarL/FixJ family response regulator